MSKLSQSGPSRTSRLTEFSSSHLARARLNSQATIPYSSLGPFASSSRRDHNAHAIRSTYSISRADRRLLADPNSKLAKDIIAACADNNQAAFLDCVLGADADATTLSIRFSHEYTLLMVACKYNATQIVRWLCQNDSSSLECKDYRGNTALHHAAAAGYAKCVDHLLSSGAVAICQNNEGVSPIHYAAYHGHKDIIIRILHHASSVVNLCDSTGKTPLMLAAFRGRTQAVSALLKGLSNVNIQDTSGWTALMYAAFTGRIAICRELLEFAASRIIADFKTGKCAADLAQDSGYYEVADMLQNKEVTLRTPSLPEGVNMSAFRPMSRSTAGSEPPAGRVSQLAARSSVLRPAIERALFPSLRRSPNATSSPTRRSAYTAPKPMRPPLIPPPPARPQSQYKSKPAATVSHLPPRPLGLNIVIPSSASAQRATRVSTRLSNLAPIPESSSVDNKAANPVPSVARSSATQKPLPAVLPSNTTKPRSHPSSTPAKVMPAAKPSTNPVLAPKPVNKDLEKQVNRQARHIVRKSVPAAATLSSAVNLIAATPVLPSAPVAGPLHTPIVVAPDQQSHHHTQPGSGWGQRGDPAPNQGASKATSISDRIKETISRASLMYLDSRTSQALKREEAAPLPSNARLIPANHTAARLGLGRPPEAKYVSLGSAARRRKTTSPSSRKVTPQADPYKRYHNSACIRPYWNTFSMIVTLWMPNFILSKLLKKETAEKRQAWREKIALCFIILLITAFTALISFGLSTMLCHPVDPISLQVLREKHGTNGTQKLTAIRGRIYDMTRAQHVAALGLSPLQLGGDASGMFAPFPEVSKRCKHWPQGKSGRNCYSVFGEDPMCKASKQQWDTLRQLETNKWVSYQWNDVLHRNSPEQLFVYNEFVFSLKPYLAEVAAGEGHEYFGKGLTQTLRDLVGTDATLAVSRSTALQALVPCWEAQLRLGRIEGSTVGCVITSGITISVTVVLNVMILIKLACAVLFDWAFSLQLTKITKHFIRGSSKRVPHVLITITCYDENEDTIRSTLDSIALTNYASSRKIVFIIADGEVTATGDTRTTPQVLRSLITRTNPAEPIHPLPYIAIGEGPREFNAAEVIPGSYVSLNGITVSCILIIKVGTKRERETEMFKAGNRGKRDSQLIILQWLRNVLLNDHLTPLEFELCRSASQLAKLNPDQFEYLLMVDADTTIDIECIPRLVAAMERDPGIMGLCGETRIANKRDSWVTRIQVYEYYISHHLSKAFESLWGGVTCLPGCCSMYRIFSNKTHSGLVVPLLVAPEVIDAYSSNDTHTLHQKNLLLLGEDRYLTTVLLRAFPKRKLIYVPRAICRTTVPNKFSVLVSQRRRWINSTIHNLLELILVRDLCGTFCCSMQFLVLMDLLGNVVLPSSVIFFYYLIVAECIGSPVGLPLLLMALTFVLQGVMILLTTQRVAYIYWMVIYILAIPVWNFIMPVYAFWRFDDFSWGKTRMVGPEDSSTSFITDDERQALEPIPLMRWKDWMRDNLGLSGGHTLASVQGLNSSQLLIASTLNTAQRTKASLPPVSQQLKAPEPAELNSAKHKPTKILKRVPAIASK
ncbi:ATP-dependent RNA helicase [Coemansia sp. RSA 376]|nr:ATP-dependent RNA helicase [Coemansia sp. RSA 376]